MSEVTGFTRLCLDLYRITYIWTHIRSNESVIVGHPLVTLEYVLPCVGVILVSWLSWNNVSFVKKGEGLFSLTVSVMVLRRLVCLRRGL